MDDPDTIEVDNKVADGTLFIIRLEKCPVPVYSIKLHEPLRWR